MSDLTVPILTILRKEQERHLDDADHALTDDGIRFHAHKAAIFRRAADRIDELEARMAEAVRLLDDVHYHYIANSEFAEEHARRSRLGLCDICVFLAAVAEGGDSNDEGATMSDDVCTGDTDCTASPHWHGCYADHDGDCEAPFDHRANDVRPGDYCPGPAPPQTAHRGWNPACPECGDNPGRVEGGDDAAIQ